MAHAYFLHEEWQSIHYFQMNILICVTKTVIWAKDDFPRHRDENKIYLCFEKSDETNKIC